MSKKLILLILVLALGLTGSIAIAVEQVWREAEAADSIAPPLGTYPDDTFDLNPVNTAGGKGKPSGGKYIGTTGDIDGNNDLIYTEGAKYSFTVRGGTYKIIARVSNVQDDSFWVRLPAATTNTKNNNNGWILWNGIKPKTPDWHWVQVHSSDDSSKIVHFTLPAGTHTVEWMHRENENFLDGFVITDNLELDPATLPDVIPQAPEVSEKASNPCPADKEQDVPCKAVLVWTPGKYAPAADGHRIYLGENIDDITQGLESTLQKDTLQGTPQDINKYPTTGTLNLEFGKTYYWRVDEANSTAGWDTGDVWQFTVEPRTIKLTPAQIKAVTAISKDSNDVRAEKTIDLSGLDADDTHSTNSKDMWLSKSNLNEKPWIQYELDKVYKLHKMSVWNYNAAGADVRYGVKDAVIEYSTDGTNWTKLGSYDFAIATGEPEYMHNTTIDFKNVTARYVKITANSNHNGGTIDRCGLSEVRFFRIPPDLR